MARLLNQDPSWEKNIREDGSTCYTFLDRLDSNMFDLLRSRRSSFLSWFGFGWPGPSPWSWEVIWWYIIMILWICRILLCCHPEPNMHKKCQSRVCSQPILPNHGFFSWTWLVTTWLEPQIIESKITFDASWRLANHVSISLCRDLQFAFEHFIWLVFVWHQRSTVLAIAFQAQLCFWCVSFFGRFAIPADAGPSWHPDSDICRKSTSKYRGVGFSECKKKGVQEGCKCLVCLKLVDLSWIKRACLALSIWHVF